MGKNDQLKRRYEMAKTRDSELKQLRLLPGEWKGVGTGWNMIALPFDQGRFNYRVLMNQYDETLKFTRVGDNVPNRGLAGIIDNSGDNDQFIVTLDYQQTINQQVAEDFPVSGLAGDAGLDIHHEPGLWLQMKNLKTIDKDNTGDTVIEVARLATIPHGNSVLAVGAQEEVSGAPTIPPLSGLPIGPLGDVDNSPYLEPYKHFIDKPFVGNVTGVPGFPGFHPNNMNAILEFANRNVNIKNTTILTVDSTRLDAGVVNIPFIVKQAESVSMRSTFWIQELADEGEDGYPKLRLQYSQIVMLDFFRPRRDQFPGRIQWPHISINTLEKVSGSSEYAD